LSFTYTARRHQSSPVVSHQSSFITRRARVVVLVPVLPVARPRVATRVVTHRLELALILLRELIDQRGDHAARTAPRRPKINEHGDVRLKHVALKRRISHHLGERACGYGARVDVGKRALSSVDARARVRGVHDGEREQYFRAHSAFALPPRSSRTASVVTARLSRSLVRPAIACVPRATMDARARPSTTRANDRTRARDYFHFIDARRPPRIARVASSSIGVVVELTRDPPSHRVVDRARSHSHSRSSPPIAHAPLVLVSSARTTTKARPVRLRFTREVGVDARIVGVIARIVVGVDVLVIAIRRRRRVSLAREIGSRIDRSVDRSMGRSID